MLMVEKLALMLRAEPICRLNSPWKLRTKNLSPSVCLIVDPETLLTDGTHLLVSGFLTTPA